MDFNTAIEPNKVEGLGWYDSDKDTEEERDIDTESEMVDNVAVIWNWKNKWKQYTDPKIRLKLWKY